MHTGVQFGGMQNGAPYGIGQAVQPYGQPYAQNMNSNEKMPPPAKVARGNGRGGSHGHGAALAAKNKPQSALAVRVTT